MTDTNNPSNPNATGVDFPMDEAPPETPVASHGPNPAGNPISAARSTNPFDPDEEEDTIDPETQEESLKEQQRPFGYPPERDLEEDILIHVCTQVLKVGTDFQAWLQAERVTNVATLLSYDLDDYAASGFDIPRPLYKMICALAHWYLYDPSAINEGDERLFFLTRKDLQRHMVTMMRPKADEMSQAASTAENFTDPASGSNDLIDPAIDPAGADDFIDPAAGTTVPDDVTVPTGTTVPGDVTVRDITDDVTDDVNGHVTTRGIPGLTPTAHSSAAHSAAAQKAAHTSSNPNDGNMSSNFFAAAPAGANSAKAKLLQRRSTLFGWTPLPTSKPPASNPTVPAPKKPPNLPRVPVLPAAQPKSSTAPPAVSQQPLYQVVYPTSSKASDFDKGSRRSSSDYKAFSDKNQWTKWQRQLLGTAFEHKVERVLDPSFCPDPNDPDDIALFGQQQRFLYSVFCKTLQEGKAADILRGYSNMKSPNFGDAQSIYAELVDHFEAGNVARVSAETLETKLTTMRLNKSWSKSVTAFVNSVSHVICDHKEATGSIQSDTYYIEKLNATFSEHKDMSQHIQALEHTDDAVARRIGGPLPPKTYESQLHELHQYATILDSRYANIQAHRQQSSNNSNRKGGKGGGGQGGQSQGGSQGQGGQGGHGKGGGQGGQQSGRSQGRGSNQGGGQGS